MRGQKKNLAKLSSLVRKIKVLKLQNSNSTRQLREARSEIEALKRNNLDLAQTTQRTKEQNALIIQEKFKLDSAHHELSVKYESLKIQIEKFKLAIRSIDDELTNVAIPGLVAFSDCIKCFKFRVNECLADVHNGEESASLPRQSEPIFMNRSSAAHQQSSTVNPMIHGYIIQKPVINIQRIPATVADNYEIPGPSRYDGGNLSHISEETSAEIMVEENTVPAPSRRGGLRYTLNIFNKNNSTSARNKENPLNKSPQFVHTSNASDDSSDDVDETLTKDAYYSPKMSYLPNNKDKLKEEYKLDDERSVHSSPVTNYDPLEGPSWRYKTISDENEQTTQSELNSKEEDTAHTSRRRNRNKSTPKSGDNNESDGETMNGNLSDAKTSPRVSGGPTISFEEDEEFVGFESEDVPSIHNKSDFLEKSVIFPNVATRRKKTARQENVSTRLRSSRSSSKNDDSTLVVTKRTKSVGDSYISFKLTSKVACSSPLDHHEISNNNSSDDRSNITRKRGGRKGSKKNRQSTSQSNSNFVSLRGKRWDSSSSELTNGNNTNRVDSEEFSNQNTNIESKRPKRAASHKVSNYQEPSLNKKLRR